MFEPYDLDNFFTSTNPESKKIKAQQQSYQYIQKSILPSCLNNLNYPTCMIENHQQQPLSMLCIDQKCEARGLICAICQGDNHFEHLCMPLKVYLNEVYGHLYDQKTQKQKINESVIQKEIQSPAQKGKSKKKNKGKHKLNLPQIPIKGNQKTNFKTYDTSSASSMILFFAHKIEQNKSEVLRQISRCKDSLIQKLDFLETSAIKYYNKLLQQISSIIPLQNPIVDITKIMENIRYYKQLSQKGNSQTEQNQINYTNMCQKETIKLKKLLATILKQTNIKQKFTLTNKMQAYYLAAEEFKTTFNKTFTKSSNQYLKNINENISQVQLKLVTGQNYQKYTTTLAAYQFSSTMKGHKFILRNQNKVGEQTGMESSGQRLMLMQPSLPKSGAKYNQKSLTWALKIVKLVGWIGVGMSLKNIIVKANYHFNYTNIGHGNYFISNNAYCWSHSLKQYNSASKSFSFTTGDTIYIKYFPSEKKLKFVKNKHESQIELDVVDPPADDQYVPSVNMCSNGDTIEVIDDRIQIVL